LGAVLKSFLVYAGVTGLFALFFICASLGFDPDFLSHYRSSASEFLVDSSLQAKIRETLPYFQRLFYQVSGTYYTPDIRFQLCVFAALTGASLFPGIADARLRAVLAAIFGIWAGMTAVGRFSPPYVVFFFPFGYLLLLVILHKIGFRTARTGLFLCAAVISCLCITQVYSAITQKYQYAGYLSQIASSVPASAKTIGNLNAGYHFANNALRDYRNLPHLKPNGLSPADYIQKNDIEYIIVSDELHLLHALRPVWNGIYGNINFLPEMEEFLRNCVLVKSFTDNQYGVRLTGFQNTDRDFTLRIYRCPRS
jgi:hypothetical protein